VQFALAFATRQAEVDRLSRILVAGSPATRAVVCVPKGTRSAIPAISTGTRVGRSFEVQDSTRCAKSRSMKTGPRCASGVCSTSRPLPHAEACRAKRFLGALAQERRRRAAGVSASAGMLMLRPGNVERPPCESATRDCRLVPAVDAVLAASPAGHRFYGPWSGSLSLPFRIVGITFDALSRCCGPFCFCPRASSGIAAAPRAGSRSRKFDRRRLMPTRDRSFEPRPHSRKKVTHR